MCATFPGTSGRTLEHRFGEKCWYNDITDCIEWMGSRCATGYGNIYVNGRMQLAHRVAYEWQRGPIPAGLVLDHLCRNEGCVNPDHLEAVTHIENVRRGYRAADQLHNTHCPSGHPYSGKNLYRTPEGGRACRTCRGAARDRITKEKRADKTLCHDCLRPKPAGCDRYRCSNCHDRHLARERARKARKKQEA